MTMAPIGNFNGIIKHVGELTGAAFPGRSFNNQILNTVTANNPVLVGMGNAIKIYIGYEFPALAFTKVTIGLYWIQRVVAPEAGNEPVVPSGVGRANIIRKLDGSSQTNCNDIPFFDAIASPVASGSPRIDERQMNWQLIDLPLVAQPVAPAILPVTIQAFPYTANGRGIIYETIAKADELFLYSQVTPDTLMVGTQSRITVDIAIGGNANGESK